MDDFKKKNVIYHTANDIGCNVVCMSSNFKRDVKRLSNRLARKRLKQEDIKNGESYVL